MKNFDKVFQNVEKKSSGRNSKKRPNLKAIFGNTARIRPKVELSSNINLEDFQKVG